jgi:hypothetical protein
MLNECLIIYLYERDNTNQNLPYGK